MVHQCAQLFLVNNLNLEKTKGPVSESLISKSVSQYVKK